MSQCERLAAETTPERDARFYSKWETNWQLRKRCQVWNVTEQDTGNNRLSNCHCVLFNSIPSKPRCINPMQAWLHWCYASLVSRLFLVPSSWQRVMKQGIIRGEQDWRLPIPVVRWRLLAFTLLQISRKFACSNKLCLKFVSSFCCSYVRTICITLGLTRACNHANRVSGVNNYT